MPRKKLIRTNHYVYHITTRSNSKEWFYLVSKEVWLICCDLLFETQKRFGIEIHAFVLMSNHYHLLVRTPQSDIDKVMAFFNKKLSDRINMSAGRTNRVFGAPYRWNIIQDRSYYMNAYRYVYQNPIRADLCKNVELYPYSTLTSEIGITKVPFQIYNYIENIDLVWLNNRFSIESEKRIRSGFRKPIFRPLYEAKTRKNTPLD